MNRIRWMAALVLVLCVPAGLTLREQIWPRQPMVEFQGAATVTPETVAPGQDIEITYYVRRNRACPAGEGEVIVRWYNVSGDDLVATPRFNQSSPLAEAGVSESFGPWLLRRRTPDGLWPGRWAYYPQLKCGTESVTPQPAYFTVAAPSRLDAFREQMRRRGADQP